MHPRMRLIMILIAAAAMSMPAIAQRGTGNEQGMGRMAEKPQVVTFTGEVVSVTTERCKYTGGGGGIGTHFILQTEDGEKRNIHLGPADVVRDIADHLLPGQTVKVHAFRRDNMPEGHYIAQSVEVEDVMYTLRDDDLRPFWAGRSASAGPGRGGGMAGRRQPPGAGMGGPDEGGRGMQATGRAARASRPMMRMQQRMDDLEARIEKLEKLMEKLSRQIEKMQSEK